MPEIITTHVHPPIPCRDFDWCAYYEGEEEGGNYGWGKTEPDAVERLISDHAKIDCDICGDCHEVDSIPLSCETGDGNK